MIRLVKNILAKVFGIFSLMHNRILFRLKNVDYKNWPRINGKIKIFKNGKIFLGKNIKINSGSKYNPIGGDTRTIFSVANNATLEIGDSTGISNTTIVCKVKIKIGNHVKIGGSTKIYDTDFHSLDYTKRSKKSFDIPINKPIEIKDHAFIGAHSILLKGVTIGEKSIIGAGSVVTKNVPDGEIWAGNPAKFIKKVNH